ncbi:heavy metal response regulator transcription factor [Pigmentiphaga sp. GD03639]|uniref:heavy metal response regulator transcription factor n=1 Tax=unclassified Pigmentiphaga TaxID=2626614 RepID=UPI000B408E0E|nr:MULTISPECIES: heavy metal response regulator transcription factor [unclassified Pigmentiphaga]MDH2240163.1 heavy metal response regulator transcription factor [Pigmentiphaga sp. GD03639]OVZ58347.1 DNA-binding response regulator [Pigmentiphaga sp. NML030171]OVZ63418.1 DNA-binding response regulator [Pigmentiphaga sp. NML080357]
MKLLVVEDERKLAAYLARGLQEEGYQVDVAHTGLDGLHLAVEFDYDLILLDWMLPGVDGFSILQVLRRTRKTPVLMLTAKSDVDDRVRGLRAGADDYLTKPFSFSELIARVEALLRRGGSESADAPQTMFKMADLEVDLVKHRARRGDEVLDLSPKEFSLLKLFLEHPGRALTRTFIAEHVWNINFDTETNVVEVAIRRLRLKLDTPFPKPLLHTIRGVGYILEDRDAPPK